MIESKVKSIALKSIKTSKLLRSSLSQSFSFERTLEKRSLSVKKKLVEDRNRTLTALTSGRKGKGNIGGAIGGSLLLGGGLLSRTLRRGGAGGGLLRGRPKPISPLRGGGLSRLGKAGRFTKGLAVVGTGLDFIGRRAEGQTSLQAGVGAGGGLAGALGGAKIGAAIGTAILPGAGTAIGGIGGSIIGSLAGGRIADLFTGAERRRKFEEDRAILSTGKSLFSGALDDFDRLLDKFGMMAPDVLVKKSEDEGLFERSKLSRPSVIKPDNKPKILFTKKDLKPKKSLGRKILEEAAKIGLAVGLTTLLVPSDPSDAITTVPIIIKLRKLYQTSELVNFFRKNDLMSRLKRRFKNIKGDELLPGRDIPGKSRVGNIKTEGNKLLKQLQLENKIDKLVNQIRGKKSILNPKGLDSKSSKIRMPKNLKEKNRQMGELLDYLRGSKEFKDLLKKVKVDDMNIQEKLFRAGSESDDVFETIIRALREAEVPVPEMGKFRNAVKSFQDAFTDMMTDPSSKLRVTKKEFDFLMKQLKVLSKEGILPKDIRGPGQIQRIEKIFKKIKEINPIKKDLSDASIDKPENTNTNNYLVMDNSRKVVGNNDPMISSNVTLVNIGKGNTFDALSQYGEITSLLTT
tara:strand:+ start:3521 stop:5410 length:1890 start_codon:yes stop_codon:yes gene_type:complete